jgi:hypothetical protein
MHNCREIDVGCWHSREKPDILQEPTSLRESEETDHVRSGILRKAVPDLHEGPAR